MLDTAPARKRCKRRQKIHLGSYARAEKIDSMLEREKIKENLDYQS